MKILSFCGNLLRHSRTSIRKRNANKRAIHVIVLQLHPGPLRVSLRRSNASAWPHSRGEQTATRGRWLRQTCLCCHDDFAGTSNCRATGVSCFHCCESKITDCSRPNYHSLGSARSDQHSSWTGRRRATADRWKTWGLSSSALGRVAGRQGDFNAGKGLGQTRAYTLMPQPETGKMSCVHHLPCARLSPGVCSGEYVVP
jgi:hypothetical protein